MLTDLDISSLAEFHQAKGALATVTLFRVEDPSAYGIVEIDGENRILRFVEKPAPGTTSSKLANAGIYMLEPEVIDYIPPETFYDFGYDLFPALLSKGVSLYGYITTDSILDAGTMDNYRKAEQELLEGRFFPKRVSPPVTNNMSVMRSFLITFSYTATLAADFKFEVEAIFLILYEMNWTSA